MLTGAEVYRKAFVQGLRPESRLTVSEWADSYRMLSQRASAEPGRWRTSRTPYLKEIMDCLSVSSHWETVVFMKGSQIGAPLSLDTPIPTVSGWTTMGEIRVGDQIFDDAGNPCSVTYVSPIFSDRQCYKLTLSDGSVFLADGEHRWSVWDEKKYEYRSVKTLRTEDIARTFRCGTKKLRSRYAIDNCRSLVLPEAALPIGPYSLGAWLGDGNSASNQITTHTNDANEMAGYISAEGHPCTVRVPRWIKGNCVNLLIEPTSKDSKKCLRGHVLAEVGVYHFDKRGKPATKCAECARQQSMSWKYGTPRDPVIPSDQGFFRKLRTLGVINNKHIPMMYLRASAEQRLALLQGLMDTDGSVAKNGRCEFSTNSPRLSDDVSELLASLGLKPRVDARPPKANRKRSGNIHQKSVVYRQSFLTYADLPVCKLARKVARIVSAEGRRTTETKRRRIINVEPTATEPVRCISVDSRTHLYLAGRNMVPTHNTECGNNWIGYIIHHAPGPVMSIQPTVEMAKRNSKQRINSLVEESPVLRKLVQSPRSRDSGNTILSKEFPGGLLVMTGANSAVGLRSMAARDLFLDEVDAYPLDVDGEGDPISLAMARTRTFARRKIFLASTPIDEGTSRIQKAYEGSDQRHYFVPCPFCDHFQVLTFERIRWAPGYPDTAAYYCESCEHRIDNHYKTIMLERGEWRATAPGDGRTAGFHLPSYYSPVGWFSFSDAAAMWERADKLNDDSMRKVFVNTVDAKTWRTRGDAPDWKRIYERAQAEDLPKDGTVPLRGLFLTAGADVQKDRIEIQVIAWGRGKESWLIDHHILPGDPSRQEVWEKLTEYANRTFIHKTGLDLPIVRLAIDSGDQTQTVYAWVRTQGPGRVLAVKGFDNGNAIVGTPSAVDLNWQGKKLRRAVKLWPVNVSALKVEFYGWLKLDSPTEESGRPFPAGYCHFPPMNEEFFKQLTAEQLVTKIVKGYQKTEWQKIRDRNEALDCRIYGRAAASQFGMDRFSSRDWDFLEGPVHEALAAKKAEEKAAADQAAGIPAPPGPAPLRVDTPAGWLPKKSGWFNK